MRISDWSSDVCSSDLQDTGLWFRRKVLAPFLAQYLVDDAPKADIARVTAFETGANQWQRLSDWPNCGAGDCVDGNARLYLQPKGALGFEPAAGPAMTADYISDPAKPVPVRARPLLTVGYDGGLTWRSDGSRVGKEGVRTCR